ncbi:fumarylacetoacetate hydrolase family protein [Actinocorallia sp. A-T 12471]|uniref:fumarylacetoacetate hydrolase family protein n=1 Tax=Actinocorallia sp. A-T 12471 TaxID=3089813 RepID=UPI0029D2A492|nr:fumarylacetoacetate hydrolase family protein [Actinocorallia sp. A-T 12471]MDX6739136.1 fumarylacetoacetate hydrolase family protein [Actinocorallia sp. A-T 12471]
MRFGNLDGRAAVFADAGAIDVAKASAGRFGPDPQDVYAVWDEFRAWAEGLTGPWESYDEAALGAPAPKPGQVFAIGLNYANHAAESGFTAPAEPAVFTKFQSSITGPYSTVELPTETVDYEAEMVVVIGRAAHRVSAADAWDHIAGVTIGQDLSERTLQLVGPAPQFSLGKSFPGFAPTGPWLVTSDELPNRDDLALGCAVGAETLQDGRTRDLIFTVPVLIERLSAVTPLSPGDLIFTGTPAGVGMARTPQRFLRPGDTLTTWVEGVGELRTPFTEGVPHKTSR